MTLKIEGYDLNQLAALGKQVGTVDTRRLSISGDAHYVANVYMALGLFAPVVSELKKFAPNVEPISDELRLKGKLMGLTDADMDAMRAGGTEKIVYQTILPNESRPFGIVFPVGDKERREKSLVSFRWVLRSFVAQVMDNHDRKTPAHDSACAFVEAYYDACLDVLSEQELDFAFGDLVAANGKSTNRYKKEA